MPIAAPNAGDRILNTDLGAFYNLLKGVAASGEAITLVYNAAGVIAFIPSSDPAASTQLFQIKNAASTVKSALTAGGGALFSSQVNFAKGSDIASAGTTDLSTITGNYAQVSGTTTITAFGTVQAGTIMVLEFQGILTLTHNASSLILKAGANATTATGDIYAFVSEGSGNWREVFHLTGTGSGSFTQNCRVNHNAAQSITTATATALAFNSERYDTDTMHDTVTNNSRITFTTAGKYLVTGHVEWASNSTGVQRYMNIRLNGATILAFDNKVPLNGASTEHSISTVYSFAANDYVELMVLQDSGGGLNVNSTGNYSPEFTATRVG